MRWEFDGFAPVAMAGSTAAHDAIQSNLVIASGYRLRGTPCRVHGSKSKIEVVGRVLWPGDALALPKIGVELPLNKP